jgi:carboxyl-terminal processing protease
MVKRLQGLWVICACSLLLFSTNVYAAENSDTGKERILEIYDLLSQHHLSGTEASKIENGAIQGMIDSLDDPFTTYFTDKEFTDFQNSLEGTYAGVGIILEEKDGQLIVNEVFEGSPAVKAGIQAGDKILSFDGQAVTGKSIETIVSEIKGEAGTKVTIKFQHQNSVHEVELTRKQIDLPVVKSDYLAHQFGYLQLAVFNDEAADTFATELSKLKQKNMKGLIIDLRDNPGGMLSAAVKLSSLFIKEGPVVYVKDRNGIGDHLDVANGQDWNLPIVVLVNGNSGSAAEILTAALKDYGKATVIGEKTYGKGTVQDIIPLQSGGVLKMTVDEYMPPKHEKINHIGITPDVLVGDPDEQLQAAIDYLSKDNTLVLKRAGNVFVNGQRELGQAPVAIRVKGSWYLSMRKLSYLFQGKLGYDPTKDEVNLELGHTSHVYYLRDSSAILLKDGNAYLSLDKVVKAYPMIQAISSQEGLIVKVQK